MSFGIIIKGKNQPSSSKRFKPHYSVVFPTKKKAVGQMIWTKEDYLKKIKENNLVPYEKPKPKPEKKYKASKWAHEMVETIKRSKGNPGSAFYRELEKKGFSRDRIKKMNQKSQKMKGATSGGFSEERI